MVRVPRSVSDLHCGSDNALTFSVVTGTDDAKSLPFPICQWVTVDIAIYPTVKSTKQSDQQG